MKTILLSTLLLLLISCGKGPRPSAPDLHDCIEGHEPTCTQLPPESPVVEEEPTPAVVEPVVEPVVQPVVQIPWTPSLSGRGDLGYSNMLYVRKFSIFLYDFENTDTITDRFALIFKSNVRNVPNAGSRYARAFFTDGYKMRLEEVNAETEVITSVWNYEWTLHDDWNLTINNNYIGTQLKTEEQALEGAYRWDHNITVNDYQQCNYILWVQTDCWWVTKEQGVYAKYYYE